MSGKAYTMREMKKIVDYLTENKLYGELKGRKMWMDFASSGLTNRTWQSLKETFLKRILPDIHNPYYKLTREQIISFTEKCDVEAKERNKLEIVAVSDDSNSNAQSAKDKEPSSTSNEIEGEKAKGEDTKSSKISSRNRSSADTVVVENCYETAEEIQRALESPITYTEKENRPVTNKSIRDYITYSEPLTPMLQEVLHDFASESDSSDKEPQMEIVENSSEMNNQDNNVQSSIVPIENKKSDSVTNDVGKNAKGLSAEVVEEVLLSETHDIKNQSTNKMTSKLNETENIFSESKSDEKNADKITINSDKTLGVDGVDDDALSKDRAEFTTTDAVNHIMTNDALTKNKENANKRNEANEKSSQNCSDNTIDTILPNNQEGLEAPTIQTQKEINTQDVINIAPEEKASRKRSISHDNLNVDNKKKKEDKSLTDTENANNSSMPVTKSQSKENKSDVEKIPDAHTLQGPHEEPPTSKQTEDPREIITISNGSSKEKSPQPNNPCLKSVSLFAEQFNDTKYSDSDTSDVVLSTTKQAESKEKTLNIHTEVVNENVVLLKSHSESDSNGEEHEKESKIVSQVSKRQRNKALANVFGFSSGAVTSNRKTRLSLKKSNTKHRFLDSMGPVSSEWTSESDSEEYVSPPRGRKSRQTKKFLKPKSARILSLEEDGGLFVMYGKRIYPLVKDGKIVKNYLTYSPHSDSDIEDETYWKIKYEEEKKKSEGLKKLLEAKEPIPREPGSPILPTNTHRTPMQNPKQSSHNTHKSPAKEVNITKCEDKKAHTEEKIKIKFTRNNEEVHLEGHWPQIHPVLEQVVNIFHKEVDAQVGDHRPKMLMDASDQAKEMNSGKSTPVVPQLVDPAIQEKVNKIETEIFKEIEKIDKEEQSRPDVDETNVTKRKAGRPRIVSRSSVSTQSPAKKTRRSKQKDEMTVLESTNKHGVPETEPENKDPSAPRVQTRTPRNILNEAANTQETRLTRTRKSKQTEQEVNNVVNEAKDDNDVRYMFPPNKKRSLNRSSSNNSKREQNGRSSEKHHFMSSPDNISRMSESTQGYQDSDVSPMKFKRKKKLSLSTIQHRGRKHNQGIRRKSYPYHIDRGMSTDSSSTSLTIRNKTTQNSSEIYKSDSYRHLFPKQKKCIGCLQRIDEASPNINNYTNGSRHFEAVTDKNGAKDTFSSKANTDVGSSSNISLPLSPELSVVENISISKALLDSIEDCPNSDETQVNDDIDSKICGSKYTIPDLDVSIPLMEQMCEFNEKTEKYLTTSNVKRQNRPSISESLLNKICTVNIDDNCTMSDSLDRRLQQLLLESAKKITKAYSDNQTDDKMDVDENLNTVKKSKAKKRCSTPRKKKANKISEVLKVDAVVDECMESCFYGGRKSCPPSIQVFDDNAMTSDGNIPLNNNIEPATKAKTKKKKKDIIKVKILRPRDKNKSNERLERLNDDGKMSICTDSGINDTESEAFLPVFNDSIDLIHNHSETCLHANECIDNSVEFIEKSNTVISLNSNSVPSGDRQGCCDQFGGTEYIFPNILPNPLQVSPDHIESTGETVYHSPVNSEVLNASLITEDLSDGIPGQSQAQPNPSKWYLFHDDESTNSNVESSSCGGFGANLKQIFPIMCAVPDLSTITEMSRENDNSRKPTLDQDTDTRDIGSHSVFNI